MKTLLFTPEEIAYIKEVCPIVNAQAIVIDMLKDDKGGYILGTGRVLNAPSQR